MGKKNTWKDPPGMKGGTTCTGEDECGITA